MVAIQSLLKRQERSTTDTSVKEWPTVLVIVVVGTILQVVRLGPGRARDTMWAEDGALFFLESDQGLWSAILSPYAGYLHGVPRFWAWVASYFPLSWASLIIALGAALTVAFLAAYAFVAMRHVLANIWLRLTLAAAFVALPVASYEAVANLTNLHWFLLAALVLVPMAKYQSRAVWVSSLVVTVMATTSDGLTILVAPLFLYYWWQDRGRRRSIVTGTYFTFAVAHVLVMLSESGMKAHDGVVQWLLLPGTYLSRVLAPVVVGEPTVQTGFKEGLDMSSLSITLVAALVCLSLVIGAFLLLVQTRHSEPLALLLYSAVFFGAPMIVHGDINRFVGTGDQAAAILGARYFIAPALLLVAAILAMTSSSRELLPRRLWLGLTGGVSVLLWFSIIVSFTNGHLRIEYPSWTAQVEAARDRCLENPAANQPAHQIQILPNRWQVKLTCQRLLPPGN